MLGQLFRPHLCTDVLLILGGARAPHINADHWASSSSSYGCTPHLGGGSNSSDINTDHWGSSLSSATSTSFHQVSFHSRILDASSAFPTHSSDQTAPAASPPPPAVIPAGPPPLPVDRFTLPLIKTLADYLAARDLIMYWLHCPGVFKGCLDGALIMDSMNTLASWFWEGQLQTALKDGPARFLFENTGSTFSDKGLRCSKS